MPQVGKKKFSYTKAGKKKAKAYAKKTGKKIKKGYYMANVKATMNSKSKQLVSLSKGEALKSKIRVS